MSKRLPRVPIHRFAPAARMAVALLLCLTTARAAAAECAGLPRLDAATPPGFCLGLVAEGMKAPRGLLPLPNGDIIVADMGSWQPGRGRIWRLLRGSAGYAKTVLFEHLDRPHGIALGPDGKVYVTTTGRVARFAPGDARPVLADVIGGNSGVAPLPGQGRHLLSTILFDAQGKLIVGVGSATDHCEQPDGSMAPGPACPERNQVGLIRRYAMQWPDARVTGWKVLARGLRNSMALAIDRRSGTLWQGENGRDGINAALPALKNDDELPHDELNLIEPGADYGWPYCYDDGVASPEYPAARCRDYRAPARLLPAHAAPLGMAFYTAGRFPARFANSLIVTYHGYRKHGHRVVALLDQGKQGPAGPAVVLVAGKRGKAGSLGAPVGIAVDAMGDVLVSDDHEGLVARLHYEGPGKDPRR